MSEWTGVELALLRKHFRARGAAWVAERVGRSVQAVRCQARRQGFYTDGAAWLPWTAQEMEVVRSHYRTKGARWIAARIGRTWKAVAERARRLRATTRRAWRADDDALLRDGYASGERTGDIAARLGRTPNACRLRAKAIGLQRTQTPPATRLNERTSDERDAGAMGVAEAPKNAPDAQIGCKNGVHDVCGECERRLMCAVASPARCKYLSEKGENHG